MGKRKSNEEKAERIKKKLKKLQKRLKKTEENETSSSASNTPPRPATEENMVPAAPDIMESARAVPDLGETTNDTTVISDEEAPEELLLALGPEGADRGEVGDPILQTLAQRWQNIMSNGINKENIKQLLEKYPLPQNLLATAPTLNAEIKAIMSEVSLKRDNRIMLRQNMVGKLLAAIGKPLTNIMKGNINSKELVEHLSNAGKIAADLFHQDSMSRRYFALAGTTLVVKEAIKNEKPDELLFGKHCAEKIKSAQTIQKTGLQIKPKNFKSPLPSQQKPRSGPFQSQLRSQKGRPQHQKPYIKRTQQRKRSPPRKQRRRN